MGAWVMATTAVLLFAPMAQKDAAAATAALASADPAVRTRAACDLRALGSGALPALPKLTALLDDGSPVDAAVCGDRTWRFHGSQDSTSPGEQAASALIGYSLDAVSQEHYVKIDQEPDLDPAQFQV